LEEVLSLAEKLREIDERVRQDLEQGFGVAETMARWRGK
jgi:hypothetical protein